MDFHILQQEGVRDIGTEALDPSGNLKVMPAEFYRQTTVNERGLFAVRNGLYALHTTELVEWISQEIAGEAAIEIGAGNGVLAEALGIVATDNYQQTWPSVAQYYAMAKQPTVRYGEHVVRLDALAAVKKYRPKVVVACWVTHRFTPLEPYRGGNQDGVDEGKLLTLCEKYIFVGNHSVHQYKPIWQHPWLRNVYQFPWLYSRAMNSTPDFVAVWEKK